MFFSLNGFCLTNDVLSDIELSNFGKNYENESLANRLNRLETQFFGMTQSGDIDSRINTIYKMATDPLSNPVSSISENNYSAKKPLKRFWQNITSAFDNNGIITGYTPSISSFNVSGFDLNNNFNNNLNHNFHNNYYNKTPYGYCPYHTNNISQTFDKINNSFNYFDKRHDRKFLNRRHPFNNNNNYNPSYLSKSYIPTNSNQNLNIATSVKILED